MVDFARDEATLGVVGAGAMGQGIAQVALTGGLKVRLFDVDAGARQAARDQVGKRLDRLVEKGQLDETARDAALGRLALADTLDAFADCDAVVEAVVERLEVKREVFTALEAIVRPDCLLASNTSSIPIARIASALRHRGRVAGLHFFNPVPLMKLVEVVAAPDSTEETLTALEALGRRLGRDPVRVKDVPGFLVNLAGRAYITEALHILGEGVAGVADIDAVMRECCGYRMGPFELMDLTGLDVNYPVCMTVFEGFFADPRLRTTPGHAALYNAGRLGRKTGQGFHTYAEGRKVEADGPPTPSPGPLPAIVLLAEDARLLQLARDTGVVVLSADDGASPIVTALPRGRDATQAAFDTGVDPARLVAVDTEFDTSARITVMTPPGADKQARDLVAGWLAGP
ncbi:MAG: 3-hydroxyacyl-CoA dehydrogenase NAD-binding domain-containing protein, partial [Azospirillaceae bacterium]